MDLAAFVDGLTVAAAWGATNMNVPPIGCPRPVAAAKELILNIAIEVFGVTSVWLSKAGVWLNIKKTYLRRNFQG